MNTINDDWEVFKKLVIPPNASKIQHLEMHMSFMAGAYTMFLKMMDAAKHNEEIAHALIKSYEEELEFFRSQAIKERH